MKRKPKKIYKFSKVFLCLSCVVTIMITSVLPAFATSITQQGTASDIGRYYSVMPFTVDVKGWIDNKDSSNTSTIPRYLTTDSANQLLATSVGNKFNLVENENNVSQSPLSSMQKMSYGITGYYKNGYRCRTKIEGINASDYFGIFSELEITLSFDDFAFSKFQDMPASVSAWFSHYGEVNVISADISFDFAGIYRDVLTGDPYYYSDSYSNHIDNINSSFVFFGSSLINRSGTAYNDEPIFIKDLNVKIRYNSQDLKDFFLALDSYFLPSDQYFSAGDFIDVYQDTFTSDNAYNLGYNKGKDDGYNLGLSENASKLTGVAWLTSIVTSVFNMQITPYVTLGGIFGVIIVFFLLIMYLKKFSGG